MEPVDQSVEALTRWLDGQRWFAGKDRTITSASVSSSAWLTDDPPTRVEALTVDDGRGEVATYQIPVEYRVHAEPALAHALIGAWIVPGLDQRPRLAYDALQDKEVTNAWLAGMASGRHEPGMSFHRAPTSAPLPTDLHSLVLGGEQSNTSLVFEDAVILKVFRRLVPGINPDVELLAALAQAGNTSVAGLLGWMEGTWIGADGAEHSGTLAIATEFLTSGTVGWDLALASVRGLLGEPPGLDAADSGSDFAGESFRLGQASASVHHDLAQVLGSAELTGEDAATLRAELSIRLASALEAAPVLRPHREAIEARYAELANDGPVFVQRVHGDLHLGQVLRASTGWRILDFEGEPAKPIETRRAPQSPLKDVAGMLRSFDYAAQYLLAGPGGSGSDPASTERAHAWSARNGRAYCAGYAEAGGGDLLADTSLLWAFLLDKAVYEVVYETQHRPDWIGVPLGAIERLLTEDALAGTSS